MIENIWFFNDLKVFSCTFAVDLGITAQNSRPHVNVRSAGVDIGKFDIKVKGGASWFDFFIMWILIFKRFYQVLVDLFKSHLKKEIEKAMRDAIATAINTGVNKSLGKLPIQVPVNHYIGLNYGLVSDPIFTQFVTLPEKGKFFL